MKQIDEYVNTVSNLVCSMNMCEENFQFTL